jgi:hypothetical protein
MALNSSAAGRRSRRKGKTGELEAAAFLRELFGWTTRRSQQHAGLSDSADLRVEQTPGLWWEVKRVERLNVPRTMRVAVAQCGRRTPVLMHRPSRSEWLLTIRVADLPSVCHAIEIAANCSVATPPLSPEEQGHNPPVQAQQNAGPAWRNGER